MTVFSIRTSLPAMPPRPGQALVNFFRKLRKSAPNQKTWHEFAAGHVPPPVSVRAEEGPAAKQARREGIDFILDPMRSTIKDDLFEHIDGIRTPTLYKKKGPTK